MSLLQESIVYLLAAIIMVPISRRLGFGSILGYLTAGIIIGPFGVKLVRDPEHILQFAELGVVFLLFIVGLELQPSRLWVLRKMVFGLGSAQVVLSAAAITALAWLLGLAVKPAIIIGLILALSSTAFVLQMLAEKKTTHDVSRACRFLNLAFSGPRCNSLNRGITDAWFGHRQRHHRITGRDHAIDHSQPDRCRPIPVATGSANRGWIKDSRNFHGHGVTRRNRCGPGHGNCRHVDGAGRIHRRHDVGRL